jgi:hypothetical protein
VSLLNTDSSDEDILVYSSPRLGFIPRGKLHWIFPGGVNLR